MKTTFDGRLKSIIFGSSNVISVAIITLMASQAVLASETDKAQVLDLSVSPQRENLKGQNKQQLESDEPKTTTTITQIARNVIVEIVSNDYFSNEVGKKITDGSGVIIGKIVNPGEKENTYYVLTANHVVVAQDIEYNAIVRATDMGPNEVQGEYELTSVIRYPEDDLAILVFKSDKDYEVAKIGDPDRYRRLSSEVFNREFSGSNLIYNLNDRMKDKPIRPYIAGWPKEREEREGFEVTPANIVQPERINEGIIKYRSANEGQDELLRGMSGAGIFDDYGNLIGIHRGEEDEGQGFHGFGSSVNILIRRLNESRNRQIQKAMVFLSNQENRAIRRRDDQRIEAIEKEIKGEIGEFEALWQTIRERQGIYISFNAGGIFPKFKDVDVDLDSGGVGVLAVGYEFPESFLRIEGEVTLGQDVFSDDANIDDDTSNWDFKMYMLNLYADMPTKNIRFNPYAGIGVGVSTIEFSEEFSEAEAVENSANFTFQLKGGANLRVSDNTNIFMQYRYFNVPGDNSINGHILEAGIRINLNTKDRN